MSAKPVLAVDFDDVVAGFNLAFHPWHNEKFGANVSYESVTCFDMTKVLQIDQQTLGERTSKFVREFHHLILPIEGAKESLSRLSTYYDLQIVTSRCETLGEVTTGWLVANDLVVFSQCHFTNGYNSIYPERRRTELEVCHEIKASFLVEDADHNALEVSRGGTVVLMPERPWNGYEEIEGVFRLPTWLDIERYLMTKIKQAP